MAFIYSKKWRVITHLNQSCLLSTFNKRPMRPVSLTRFRLQNCLKDFAIPETLFEQTWISLPQGYSMPNIKAFQLVVHEKKIFEDLSICFLILPLIGPQKVPAPLFKQIWIPIFQECFLPRLVEIGLVVLEKKIF